MIIRIMCTRDLPDPCAGLSSDEGLEARLESVDEKQRNRAFGDDEDVRIHVLMEFGSECKVCNGFGYGALTHELEAFICHFRDPMLVVKLNTLLTQPGFSCVPETWGFRWNLIKDGRTYASSSTISIIFPIVTQKS